MVINLSLIKVCKIKFINEKNTTIKRKDIFDRKTHHPVTTAHKNHIVFLTAR